MKETKKTPKREREREIEKAKKILEDYKKSGFAICANCSAILHISR